MSEAPPVCMAPPVPGAGELQVRDSEGLVWPDKFPIRDDAMKLDPIGEAATTLGTMASRLVESTNQIATTWTGLQGHYTSPEAPAVHALMVPAQTGAVAVSVRLNGAKKALDDYVTTLEGLRGRLRTVISDCESFRAEALAGVWVDASKTSKANVGDFVAEAVTFGHYDRKVHVAWTEDGKMVERNEALIEKYAAVVTDVMNAAITCANTIIALPGMPSELAGEPPMTGVSPEEVMALWGDPATEDRNCMQQTGDGFYDFGKGVLEGGGMLLLGYDPETGEFFSGKAYGQAWGGLGNLVLSVGVMAVYGAAVIGTGGLITTVSFGEAGDQWMYDRAVVVRDTGASLIGYDPYAPDGDGWHNWKDEPWRVGTTTVANVVSSVIPGAGAVGGAAKGASAVSKVTRLAGMGTRGVADLALPGGSQAVRAVTLLGRGGHALLDGKGWSGMVDAMRVGTGRVRPNVATMTAGTANAVSDLGKLTPPVHMSVDVPSVSGSVRPLDGALAGVEPSGARLPTGNGVSPVDAGAPGAGSGGSPTRGGVDGPTGAGAGEVSGAGAASSRSGAGRGAEGSSVLDNVDARESWLYQDAPMEPAAAERAGGAQVPEPAREPAMAAVAGERAGQGSSVAGRAEGPGGAAPQSPRGSTTTVEPPRTAPGPGRAPVGPDGAGSGGRGGSGADGSTGGHAGSQGAPARDVPGGTHGTGGDAPGVEPAGSARAGGGAGGEGSSGGAVGEGPGRVGAGGEDPGRVAIDDAGSPHVINTSDDLVLAHDQAFGQVVDQVAADHGLTRGQLEDLVTTPVDQLTRDQVRTLVQIRDAMPSITPDTVLQKIVTPEDAARVLAGGDAVSDLGGFVARAADTAGMPTAELHSKLGLDYPGSTFTPDGDMFAVRYRAGDVVPTPAAVRDGVSIAVTHGTDGVLDAMSRMPDEIFDLPAGPERSAAMQRWISDNVPDPVPGGPRDVAKEAEWALNPDNPFRGNGFGGSGTGWAPEVAYTTRTGVPEGAEMWRVAPDGSQALAAVFRDRAWHPIIEQPLGGPDWVPPRGGDGPGPVNPGRPDGSGPSGHGDSTGSPGRTPDGAADGPGVHPPRVDGNAADPHGSAGEGRSSGDGSPAERGAGAEPSGHGDVPGTDGRAAAGRDGGAAAASQAPGGMSGAWPDAPDAEVLARHPRPQVASTVAVPEQGLSFKVGDNGAQVLHDGRPLAPDTRYDVEGRGRVYTDGQGAVVRIETVSGPSGLDVDVHRRVPGAEYVVWPEGQQNGGRSVFTTDAQGHRLGSAGRVALDDPVGYPRPVVDPARVHQVDALPSNESFASRTGLEPSSVYHVDGRGEFYTDDAGRVVHVKTTFSEDPSLPNPDLMDPQPGTTYVVTPRVKDPVPGLNYDHVYTVSDQGLTTSWHADHIAPGDGVRNDTLQRNAGGADADYEGGHLGPRQEGGGFELINYTEQHRLVNRGSGDLSFKNIDDMFLTMTRDDPTAITDVTITMNYPDDAAATPSTYTPRGGARYTGSINPRPDSYQLEWTEYGDPQEPLHIPNDEAGWHQATEELYQRGK